jgi:hypothetical protein
MAKFRTAMGKVVDMSTLASKNERTRAVGNMKVNARGDTIDAFGRIIKPVTAKVNDMYSKTVGNKSAQVKSGPVKSPPLPKPKIALPELNELEREMENNIDEEIEIEKIKANSIKK